MLNIFKNKQKQHFKRVHRAPKHSLKKKNERNSRAEFFAPKEKYEHQKNQTVDRSIDNFNRQYSRDILHRSQQNYFRTDQWTYSGRQTEHLWAKYPVFIAVVLKRIFEFKPNKETYKKSASLLALSLVTVFTILIPVISNKVPYVLTVDSKRGVSNSASFGSNFTPKEAKREDISFAKNVTLEIRGNKETFNTTQATVLDVLKWKEVKIGYDEGVFPDLNQEVGDNELIVVDKVSSKSETVRESLPFETKTIEEPTIRKGIENVISNGKEGEGVNTYIVKEIGGHELSRTVFSALVITKPNPKIIQIGTGEILSNGTLISVGSHEAKQFALKQVVEQGWADSEFSCLDQLWQRESGWRTNAGNQISGAYGIPQALPGSKMQPFGDDWRTNPETQIRWGINYIKNRYGSPCAAWGYWQVHKWY